MRVLVTGATGFVGKGIAETLEKSQSCELITAGRNHPKIDGKYTSLIIDNFNDKSDWIRNLQGVDVLIHCAARAHIMVEDSEDPLSEYMKFNCDATLSMAEAAVEAGVKRLIFLSSIKVNGESTESNEPFSPDDEPNPVDPYGLSKLEAENGLKQLAANTDLEVVVIRPPLVYGPGVKGNFAAISKIVLKEWPLPLGSVHNLRSMISLDNLVSVVMKCIDHPLAANQTFLVSDGDDISTTDLIRRLAAASGARSCLVPVPQKLLDVVIRLLGKGAIADRLFGNLQLDISKTKSILDWEPPFSVEEGFRKSFSKE